MSCTSTLQDDHGQVKDGLITQRSQVQILPPLRSSSRSEAVSGRPREPPLTVCEHLVSPRCPWRDVPRGGQRGAGPAAWPFGVLFLAELAAVTAAVAFGVLGVV